MKSSRLFAIAACASFVAASSAQAQPAQQRFQGELRADGLFATNGAVHAGYGITVPLGVYLRTGLVAGLGAGSGGAEGRLDALWRFSLDPFRQSRWAPYGGAGISGRFRPTDAGGSHPYLMSYLGLEGPLREGHRSGWVPAIEIGLGGGTRVGVILRRGIAGRR